mmetsp:Transcript_11565/g.19574  ORF Transcript_11565/g.19574 Transcript_11565/m.19574 type:complete len:469 (-) Transcript_11565:110-1516(-)
MDAPASATGSATSSVDGRSGGSGGSELLNLGMFGQTSGVSDLLLGTSSFGGSFGNGYTNEASTANSVSSSAAPTPGASSAFDLSDFPSLGGTSSGSSSSSTNGLAAALRQQQLLAHQQQMLQPGSKSTNASNLYRLAMQGQTNGTNFNVASEDFPALPGAPVGSNGGGNNGSLSGPSSSPLLLGGNGSTGSSLTSNSPFGSAPSVSRTSSGSGNALYSGELESTNTGIEGTGLLGGAGLSGLGSLTGLQSGPSNQTALLQRSAAPSTSAPGTQSSAAQGTASAVAGSALSGDYGLLGLLSVIRMTDADRNALALGTDLTLLGLNLNASDSLYTNFAGPWSDSPTTKEPHYQLPMCYYMQPPALKTGHLSKFQLETLFYIFYALPKDILQAYAAQELYTREWRYHGELKRWFKRAGPADGIASSSNGAAQYLYFDINSWERRLFTGNMNQSITGGFLSEDDVRVKFPSS